MICNIVKDTFFLSQKSDLATKEDLNICMDLIDTLQSHEHECIGMAANMIGKKKRIIIARIGRMNAVMNNPVILKKSDPYETEEGCLSLSGTKKVTRYKKIIVEYYDMKWKKQKQVFTDLNAQIIQHEVDHCDGILIQAFDKIFINFFEETNA